MPFFDKICIIDTDLFKDINIGTRAVMIPGLESAPEYDRSMILKFVRGDSGSGSFQVDPLESAPVLVSAPLVHCWSFLNQAEPVISYFDVPN